MATAQPTGVKTPRVALWQAFSTSGLIFISCSTLQGRSEERLSEPTRGFPTCPFSVSPSRSVTLPFPRAPNPEAAFGPPSALPI